jgi:lysophospholipase
MSNQAPFFHDVAEGPSGARALWATPSDGARVRVGFWPAPRAAKGTVFLLPGRSEYLEKYGRTAAELAERGYAMVSIDWRGQGLASRALPDPMTGHIGDFAEYQRDIEAMIDLAQAQSMPEPWHMLAHSMGGGIGLRTLMGAHPFKAAAFSAPMWGILMAAWLRPIAMALTTAARWFSFEDRYIPGTKARTYVLEQGFAGNTLTTDASMWDYMHRQAEAHPEMTLGGPSLGWLKAALAECHDLSLLPSPDLPVIAALGSAEKIVHLGPVHARMAAWPKGKLTLYQGAEHEVLMERPATRLRFLDEATALFGAA